MISSQQDLFSQNKVSWKPVLFGYFVLGRYYSIPWGCLLNTGLTV